MVLARVSGSKVPNCKVYDDLQLEAYFGHTGFPRGKLVKSRFDQGQKFNF